jgi:hypothetical protein
LTVLAHREVLPGANKLDDSAAERAGLNMTAKRNVVGFEVLTAATFWNVTPCPTEFR